VSLRFNLSLMTSLVGIGLSIPASAAQAASSPGVAKYLQSPIRFEANKGQAPEGVDFLSIGSRHSLYLQNSGVRLDVAGQSGSQSIVLRYVAPESSRHAEGVDQVGAKSAYFIGSNPDNWLHGITNYQKVRYSHVWSGIDVVYYGNHSQLEYDLVVAPGADVHRAAFQISGAKDLKVDANGNLLIQTASGDIVQHRPIAYQNTPHGRKEVEARYAVSADRVSFQIGNYDHSAELIVDPTIAFSIPRLLPALTYVGYSVAVDQSGNSWVTGTTLPSPTYSLAFVNEFDINGNDVGHFTIAATDGNVTASALALDNAGSIYITGSTTSVTGFPLAGGYQTHSGGGTDSYVIKVNISNVEVPTVSYGTYLGGSGADQGNGVAVDAAGYAYVAGQTTSTNFPVTSGSLYQGGTTDGYLTKINTNAVGSNSLVYSFFIGGSGADVATSIAFNSPYVYVGGSTQSTNLVPNPSFGFATSNPAGNANGFLMKVTASSGAANYLTFFTGGPVAGVAADSAQQAYVTGETNGAIPTGSVNQGYSTLGGTGHAFIARFNTTINGSGSLIYSSYLAGASVDAGYGVGVDSAGNATVVGATTSTNFPTAGSPLQPNLLGVQDAFVSKVNTNAANLASLVYSSYLGGSGTETAFAVGMTPWGNPVITGQTDSADFPVTPGSPLDGGTDPRAFLTKFYYEAAPFGNLDTPKNGTTNASGAVAVTGWALSPIALGSIGIWRNPVNGEGTGANGLVFVVNTDQVAGARPDIAALYPNYPNNNYGWGVQVLTNELPGTGGLPLGNGSYTFHALAVDNDGLTTDIGQTSITVDNTTSKLPFGTIDTPVAGGTVSGSYVNFGWVLTPEPANIPISGSTIEVYIDNIAVGHPVYNNYRSDIATLFPDYANSNGAVGYFVINTKNYSNGLHTIYWIVTDSLGNANGLGSRYFTISN